MLVSPSVVVVAFIWACGAWWCIQIFLRGRDDVKELREGGWVNRLAIIIVWCMTAVILFYCARAAIGVAERIVQGLKKF